MWKIKRKYLFIELMTYLEYYNVHKLLFIASKDFRHRLISSLNTIQKIPKQIANNKNVQVTLEYYTSALDKIHISEEAFNEIRACSFYRSDLQIILQVYSNVDAPYLITRPRIIPQIFGKIQLTLKSTAFEAYQYFIIGHTAFASYFNYSKPIEYNIELSKGKNIFNINLNEFIKFKVVYLKLRANDIVLLHVQLLQQIQFLQITFNADDKLKVKFEDLSIPYPKTNFQLEFIQSTWKNIVKVYSKQPDLFNVQQCRIAVRWAMDKNLQMHHIERLLQIFPQNNFELDLNQHYKLDYDYLYSIQKIQSQCKNLAAISIADTLSLDALELNQELKINKLLLQFADNILETSLESLSSINIVDEFEVIVRFNIKILETQQKIISPPKIKINTENIKIGWVQSILGILDSFHNYENVIILHLQSSMHNIPQGPPLIQLYKKLQQFSKIRELIIPFSCDRAANMVMLIILWNLKNLEHLSLENFRDQIEIVDFVNEISQSVFDNMKKLRTLNFYVNSLIKLWPLSINYRLSPLTITIIQANEFTSRIRTIYDSNFGKIIISKFENSY